MKPFTIKLFEPDLIYRRILVRHYSEIWGRKARYSEVLRELQREKVAFLREPERMSSIPRATDN